MFYQPRHDRMVRRQSGLDIALQCEFQYSDMVNQVLDSPFGKSVALRLAGMTVLRHSNSSALNRSRMFIGAQFASLGVTILKSNYLIIALNMDSLPSSHRTCLLYHSDNRWLFVGPVRKVYESAVGNQFRKASDYQWIGPFSGHYKCKGRAVWK